MSFNPKLLQLGLLLCTRSRVALVLEGESLVSVHPQHRLQYQIRDGIPNMLAEEAVELPPDVWGEIMGRHLRDPVTGQLLA